ncbi:NAD(P)H-dependent oxidoreductase [Proteus mirabilis]|uniref:FMN-dependent NADH-azoreductase n=1 Tax=Proteus mirabilis TaxID=584 RepID=UPI0025760248|nr:NAD(P)H-dependent oxidoreductase [Proteus mirabilis]MDM3557060.1 NAD(P)H-dependent oxidoreductase [Proteus mirabilis]
MNKLLVLKSSILENYSHSNKMADYLIENWQKHHQNDLITLRDLAKDPIPVLDQATLFAFGKDTAMLSEQQKAARALSDTLINELKAHDIIVITAPMYNFSIPSQLKHYIDFIARAGETFKYTETGSVGLLEDKQVIGHCCKVSDEAAFCLIQRPYISKTLLTRRISPRGSP